MSTKTKLPASEDAAVKARLRLWLKLLKTTNHIEARLRENLRSGFDTTLPRFDVMSALRRFNGGLKMSELSGVLKVSNGNVTHIVDRLVADGLVERSAVPGDRRASRVRLTRKGRREFDRQASEHALWVDELLGAVSADNADLITGELETVTSSDPVDGEPLDVNYPSMTELSSDPEADRAAELVTNLAAGLAADLAAEAAAAATSIVAGPSDEKEET